MLIVKNISNQQKSMKNYPECKVLFKEEYFCLKFLSVDGVPVGVLPTSVFCW